MVDFGLTIVAQEKLQQDMVAAVWDLLCECDYEFVPPLSKRDSFYDVGACSQGSVAEPHLYFDELQHQSFLLARVDNEIAGFMSFRKGYACAELSEASPCNYVTTLCVGSGWRRRGVAKALYDFMLEHYNGMLPVATRTWSTNTGHIYLIRKLGFKLVTHLPDHRGEGIDTLYYAKEC
jgi:ribosomal protein S18 acetylase RimI-like enzyme